MRWLFVFLVACGAAVPALPSKGGPAWIELESKHFTLWTDAGAARGTELIEQMEYLRQIVFGVAFPEHTNPGRSFAVALRDDWEVHAYLPKEFSAISMLGGALRMPTIVFAADTDESDGHVITHELSHVISYGAIKSQPPWFAEGLAEFFEAVKLSTDKALVDVGEPLSNQMYAQVHDRLVTGDQLFACREMACRDHEFYMTSGLLFMYLANTHPDQLIAFEERLAHGEDDRRAWAATFTDLPIDSIDRTLRAWQMQGRHRVWHFQVVLEHPQIKQRTLGDPDVLAIRAYLTLKHKGPDAAVEQALAAAFAADPTNVIARLVEVSSTGKISLDDARATAKAHPDDWRAWILVLNAHSTGEENRTAVAHICELATDPSADYDRSMCESAHPLDAVPGGAEHGNQPPTSK